MVVTSPSTRQERPTHMPILHATKRFAPSTCSKPACGGNGTGTVHGEFGFFKVYVYFSFCNLIHNGISPSSLLSLHRSVACTQCSRPLLWSRPYPSALVLVLVFQQPQDKLKQPPKLLATWPQEKVPLLSYLLLPQKHHLYIISPTTATKIA